MKFILTALVTTFICSKAFSQNVLNDAILEQKIKKREIPEAKIGELICLDDYANYIICNGNEFQKILGFCTNTPYITVNKAKSNNKITEHKGIASFEKGKIKNGDYLCPCKKNPGQVVRCKKKNNPYAKALEAPSYQGDLFMVKILGHRRKF